jgi:hypothetical protein
MESLSIEMLKKAIRDSNKRLALNLTLLKPRLLHGKKYELGRNGLFRNGR